MRAAIIVLKEKKKQGSFGFRNVFSFCFLVICFTLLFSSCSNDDKVVKETPKKDSTSTKASYFWNLANFPATKGALGVYDVPEMLCLSIFDSAAVEAMADHYARNYAILATERDSIGIKSNGAMGVLNYNDDPRSLKFECVLLIDQMPTIQPTHSRIVVMEATKALVYNFYGDYVNLFQAYKEIREYCEKNNLMQSGPVREFYLTDSTVEPDRSKWLTQIILPVALDKR